MNDKKWLVGFPDGSGIAGGRCQVTHITAYDDEADIYISIFSQLLYFAYPWQVIYD